MHDCCEHNMDEEWPNPPYGVSRSHVSGASGGRSVTLTSCEGKPVYPGEPEAYDIPGDSDYEIVGGDLDSTSCYIEPTLKVEEVLESFTLCFTILLSHFW